MTGAGSQLGNFPTWRFGRRLGRCPQSGIAPPDKFIPDGGDGLVIASNHFGNRPIRQFAPFGILHQGGNRSAHIRPGAPQAVILIRAAGMFNRLPAGSFPDFGGDLLQPRLVSGLQAMVAIGQPIGGAIMEDHDGREDAAGGHRRGVVTDDGAVDQRLSLLDGMVGLY